LALLQFTIHTAESTPTLASKLISRHVLMLQNP